MPAVEIGARFASRLAESYVADDMNCGSCGVQNVEYATTCYSCQSPLGSRLRATLPNLPTLPTPGEAPRAASGGGRLRWLLLAAFVFFVFFRDRLPGLIDLLTSYSTSTPEESPTPAAEEAAAPVPEAPAAPEENSPNSPPDAAPAAPAEEINGFRLTAFQWSLPDDRSEPPLHRGENVRGKSEVTGFAVSPEKRIDVIVTFAFRDPRGELVEPIDPNHLDQPVESDTLYSSFDYTIPKKGPLGDYDLEIGIDDAVSGRSARFHRTITVVGR